LKLFGNKIVFNGLVLILNKMNVIITVTKSLQVVF